MVTICADRDTEALKICVDEHGSVWVADGDFAPKDSGDDPSTFAGSSSIRGRSVRLASTTDHIDLILMLWRKQTCDLEVCTPRAVKSAAPDRQLYDLRSMNLAGSQGGWHEFSDLDYPSYAIAGRIRSGGCLDESAMAIFDSHPLRSCIAWIGHANPSCCAALIGILLDPRWFVDIESPGMREVFHFLGLNPKSRHTTPKDNLAANTRSSRRDLVLNGWKTSTSPVSGFSSFLWKHWYSCTNSRADLRTSQLFIEYLYMNWLDALDGYKTADGPLFIPEYFFSDLQDAASYRDFMRSGASFR